MGNHENFEATKSLDSTQENKISNLGSYVLERNAPGQNDHQQKTDSLVGKGILPPMNIMEFSNEYRTGTDATASDFKDSGVKCHHNKDGSTTAEYPSGVKIESTGESHSQKGNMTIETSGVFVEAEAPNHRNKKGEVIDPKGRVIAKPNEDGSVTVDSGNGFYTQYPDGNIKRESALRSRDGKTFEVLDTNTPLGNLRPSDMTHHK